MIGGEIFIAAPAKKFDIAHGLGTAILNREATVGVLYVVGRGDYIIDYFKEITVVAAIRTFESIGDFGLRKWHYRAACS